MRKPSETKRPSKQYRRSPVLKTGEHAIAAFAAAAKCPPLAHWVGRERGAPFDQARSQLLEYLTGDPDIRLWLFRCFQRSGAIRFNLAARRWQGVEVPS
jgi:hypothetical protein